MSAALPFTPAPQVGVLLGQAPDLAGHLHGVRPGQFLAPLTRVSTLASAPPVETMEIVLPLAQTPVRNTQLPGDLPPGLAAAQIQFDRLPLELLIVGWMCSCHVWLLLLRLRNLCPSIRGNFMIYAVRT